MNVPAYSFADAEERLQQIGRTGKVLGPLEFTIPLPARSDWVANCVCGVLNTIAGFHQAILNWWSRARGNGRGFR